MRISQFLKNYILHDSSIDEILYDSITQSCKFKIELCNWMQEGYKDDEPETIYGRLHLLGVTKFKTDPPSFLFTEDNNIYATIVSFDSLPTEKDESIKIISTVFDGRREERVTHYYLIIEVAFSTMEWELIS